MADTDNGPARASDLAKLRDDFAGRAMGAFITSGAISGIIQDGVCDIGEAQKVLAAGSYRVADAMIAAREAK